MKSVHDLTQNELNELRSQWYFQHLDDGSLFEVLGKEISSEHEVPIGVVKEYYSDTSFVDDDFFCNLY